MLSLVAFFHSPAITTTNTLEVLANRSWPTLANQLLLLGQLVLRRCKLATIIDNNEIIDNNHDDRYTTIVQQLSSVVYF